MIAVLRSNELDAFRHQTLYKVVKMEGLTVGKPVLLSLASHLIVNCLEFEIVKLLSKNVHDRIIMLTIDIDILVWFTVRSDSGPVSEL